MHEHTVDLSSDIYFFKNVHRTVELPTTDRILKKKFTSKNREKSAKGMCYPVTFSDKIKRFRKK